MIQDAIEDAIARTVPSWVWTSMNTAQEWWPWFALGVAILITLGVFAWTKELFGMPGVYALLLTVVTGGGYLLWRKFRPSPVAHEQLSDGHPDAVPPVSRPRKKNPKSLLGRPFFPWNRR